MQGDPDVVLGDHTRGLCGMAGSGRCRMDQIANQSQDPPPNGRATTYHEHPSLVTRRVRHRRHLLRDSDLDTGATGASDGRWDGAALRADPDIANPGSRRTIGILHPTGGPTPEVARPGQKRW